MDFQNFCQTMPKTTVRALQTIFKNIGTFLSGYISRQESHRPSLRHPDLREEAMATARMMPVRRLHQIFIRSWTHLVDSLTRQAASYTPDAAPRPDTTDPLHRNAPLQNCIKTQAHTCQLRWNEFQFSSFSPTVSPAFLGHAFCPSPFCRCLAGLL